jgi:hypothetical protein
MKDISFDLETLGTHPEAMILSIGAVKFDRDTGETGEYFSRVIDIEAPGGGGVIDASTVVWWMNKSQAARDVVFSDNPELKAQRTPLRVALAEFAEFLGFDETLEDGKFPDVTLWQRGDKDAQWLTSAYNGMQLRVPFAWWSVRDQRTVCDLLKPFMPKRKDDATAHDSLSDAYYQAECLVAAFARMRSCGVLIGEAKAPAEQTAAGE